VTIRVSGVSGREAHTCSSSMFLNPHPKNNSGHGGHFISAGVIVGRECIAARHV
jgi:hypothetical protein